MQPESAKLLKDILDSAALIQAYTDNCSRDYFMSDHQIRDAVQWNFAIIGEALSKLHKIDATTAEKIHEWNRIIAFRNQLIHGYGVVKHEITWDIIQTKLPILRQDVDLLLSTP